MAKPVYCEQLEHFAEYLRSFPREEADDDGLAGVYIGLIDMDGTLTPMASALLDLLEVEHCKRRIESAGWMWCDGPYDEAGQPLSITRGHLGGGCYGWVDFGKLGQRADIPDWLAAAEYAEEHVQEATK